MIGTPRHFGMSALVLFLIIALWGAIHYVATSPTALPDNQECVLVVGDFGRDNLAKPVLKQIEQQQTITTSGHMRVVGVDTGEYLDQYGRVTDHAGLVWDLMKKASRYRTIAVIDASTTHVSPIVIEAANSLGIPVLVTVATNDGVIAAGSWALRMPANDSAQALAIAKWCRSYGRVALIHDGTQYGAFLHRNVLDHLGDSETLSYVLDGGSSAPLLMRDIVASDSDAIVYMGYGTLGVLYRNSALLEGAGIRIQKNTRGLSRCDEGPSSSEAAGTISLEPYISASVPLQEINRLTAEACHKHSRSLAERFAQQAVSRGLGRCLVGSAGSTVLLKPHGQASKVNEQLSRSGVPGTVIRQTISASEELGIRLAFHYYHGEHDLINLLEQLECQLL